MSIQEIEDRMALKNLVDTFSILADVKDIKTQVLLFTENAIVESYRDGKRGSSYTGRKQIEDAFAGFLKNFEVVYHINGQQTVVLDGNKASGIAYCMVTLIGEENGKKMKTVMGVFYHDDYVKENGRWLIAHRKSNFQFTEKTGLIQ
ncbi:MAG: nuclear transport factor 2 family protein [Chitinophagaceae bacterium]|nr:nuclear transport factor 2 family protein [Chitinophagaceae bacterium]